MSNRTRAKYKIDRRLRVNLWGRPKSPFNTREYGPGLHGQRRRKQSDYGLQLQAKQKLKGGLGSTPKIDTKPSINFIFGASAVAHFFLSFTRFPVVLVPIVPDHHQDRAFLLYARILGN